MLEREVLNIRQLADYLQLPTNSLYYLLARQRIPGSKVGKHWRFEKREIEEWMRRSGHDLRSQKLETRSEAHTSPRILVVEQASDKRLPFRQAPLSGDYEVQEACTIAQALELAKTCLFEWAFISADLPDGSAADLIQNLLELQPDLLPVLMIDSDSSERAHWKQIESAGMSLVLTRPIDWTKARPWLTRLSHKKLNVIRGKKRIV